MLVLSMDSKRQRRPNVRLGAIGDVSAAFSCGVSQEIKKGLHWEKGLDYGFLNPEDSEYNYISGFCKEQTFEFDVTDPGFSPWFPVDMQQNRENTNPNSMNFVSEFDTLDEIDMTKSKLECGTMAQNCILTNKGRRSKRCKRTAFGSYWNSEVIPHTNTDDEKEYRGKEVIGFASNPCLNVYDAHSPDHETPATRKKACEDDTYEPTFNLQNGGNFGEFWKKGDNSLSSESFSRYDMLEVSRSDVNSVGRWLEELGFGKYAGLFERHEVDEEVLPLLTLEDLKEMGVLAVGPRRKLYTAIRQLRHSSGRLLT